MKRHLAGVALVSATLLMTELALTRIFSVVMYYHFAFLAISIALFGLSASGVFAFTFRTPLDRFSTDALLATESVVYALCTLVALFFLVRLRIGLTYSRHNLILMLTIYALAALPFFTGGLVVTLAITRMSSRVNAVYAAGPAGRRRRLSRADSAARSRRRAGRRPDGGGARADRRRALFSAGSPDPHRRGGGRRHGRGARRPALGRRRLRHRRREGPRRRHGALHASGIRSRASASTSARTATGR